MDDYAETILAPRQIWANPTTSSNSLPPTCTPFILSSGGLINIGKNVVVTLTQDAAFQPECHGTPVPQPIDPTQPGVESVLNYQDPFYMSTNPQIYAIAAVTVVSYMLVIILFITPRTFFVGGAGGGGGFLGQSGTSNRAYGSNSIIGVGSRPWLQKAATLAVAISLTIVTADTFKWAEIQYDAGYDDAAELTIKVIDGLEVKVVSIISETFLWLAQAQTLIRLFPRHKEKLVIKWSAFGLITLELIFSSTNSFFHEGDKSHPRAFVSAIPALDYLFALALNLCYAAFVIYYMLYKRRFAFWNPKMRNMPLVALLSLTAVLIPVIFFILDLSKPNVSGWGNYVRWVGAAAASVIVWEWVERIEALERDEKKDGILGREIFDGDEMLENTPSSEMSFARIRDSKSRRGGSGGGAGAGGGFGGSISTGWSNIAARTKRLRRLRRSRVQHSEKSDPDSLSSQSSTNRALQRREDGQPYPTPPAPVLSPVSRADTTSAASTVYMVRYSQPTPPLLQAPMEDGAEQPAAEEELYRSGDFIPQSGPAATKTTVAAALSNGFSRMLNPFKRQRNSPPLEVAQALSSNPPEAGLAPPTQPNESLFQRMHLKKATKVDQAPRSVIVVPAPERRRPSPGTDEDEESQVAEDAPEYDLPLPSPSVDRDSPPDAVLHAMHNPQPPNRWSQQPSGSRPNTSCDTQLSRRGTLLISENRDRRAVGEHSTSPTTPDLLSREDSAAPDDQRSRTDHER